MKTIGVIAAMEEEISELRGRLGVISVKNIVGVDFCMGKLGAKSAVLARCGIGKVNAAICAQIMIDMYAVDCIVNIGVAGGLAEGLSVGSIVVGSSVAHHDFDTTAFGDAPGLIPRLNKREFDSDPALVKIAYEAAEAVRPGGARTGMIVSGDQFVSGRTEKERINSTFGALCVEMEGAAIGQACWLNKIPFVVVRIISDDASEGAAVSFAEFIKGAAKSSADIAEALIKNIK